MTDRQKAIAAILTVIPALLLACTQWIKADAEKREKTAAYQSYGEYVTDQLHRDEALLKALEDCYAKHNPRTWASVAEGPVAAKRDPDYQEPQAQAVLDEIARSEGWQ